MTDKNKGSEFAGELMDDIDKFEHLAFMHWKKIIVACLLIVIAVAVIMTVKVMNREKEQLIATKVANAKTEQELKNVIEQFSTKEFVNSAKIKLATLYTSQKQFDQAINVYQSIANSTIATAYMKSQALLSVSYLLEIKGEKEKAANGFSAIVQDLMVPGSIRAEAGFAAGRLYSELGQKEKALENLNKSSSLLNKGSKKLNPMEGFWSEQSKLLIQKINSGNDKKA